MKPMPSEYGKGFGKGLGEAAVARKLEDAELVELASMSLMS